MLVAENLGYTLPGGRVLFSRLDLRVETGQAVAIEGPSGSGKSTLLALLGALLEPTTGTVRGPTKPNAYAWVLQALNGLPARRVVDNVRLYSWLDGDPSAEVRARSRQRLDDVGLSAFARTRAGLLSGGELQRLSIARALASSRPILLVDEPTSQLDRPNAHRMMQLLVDSAADGRAVVIVTHDREALPPHGRILRLAADGLHETPAT